MRHYMRGLLTGRVADHTPPIPDISHWLYRQPTRREDIFSLMRYFATMTLPPVCCRAARYTRCALMPPFARPCLLFIDADTLLPWVGRKRALPLAQRGAEYMPLLFRPTPTGDGCKVLTVMNTAPGNAVMRDRHYFLFHLRYTATTCYVRRCDFFYFCSPKYIIIIVATFGL